jgi:hypothetical protein
MDAAIAGAVGIVFKADFADRAQLLLERWYDILFAEAVRDEPEQWIFRQSRDRLAGVGHDEPAGAAEGRLGMAQEALVGVVPCAEPVRVGVELRKERIEFALADYRRAHRDVGAGVAPTGRRG